MKSENPVSHRIASRSEWLEAREELLLKEKALTRIRDVVARKRRELPWVCIEKPYVFENGHGKETLADLFGTKSQLLIYHFMFGPDWPEGCPSCSYLADHIDGMLPHLAAHDVSLVVVSRAPFEQIRAFQERMGWRFKWVSSFGSDFNYDFHVTSDEAVAPVQYNYRSKAELEKLGQMYHVKGEQPGLSAFIRQGAEVYHTYSTYGRGLDLLLGTYNYLDLAPKGRDEEGLEFTMAWVRHHDRYGTEPGSCCK